jgi:diguanylate cyclase (GGDEF)-like protein
MKQTFDSHQLFDEKKDHYLYKSIFELLKAKERSKEDLFSLLLDKSPLMIYVKDENMQLLYSNSKYENLIRSDPKFEKMIVNLEKKALEGKRAEKEIVYGAKVLEVSLVPFHFDSQRMVAGFIQDRTVTARKFEYLYNMIASLKKRYRYFKKCSTIDALTGALNKKEFENILYKECERAARYETPLALILFDLDNFKTINDKFGHIAGDTVLRSVAKSVRNKIRKTDFFGRIGGDEFAVLAPETKMEDAVALAEKIKESINGIIFQSLDFSSVNCSFGVCRYRKCEDPLSFLNRADKALYISKKEGRNRISWLE